MKILRLELEGLVVIEPQVYRDARGFFLETFQARKYKEAGLPENFVQDNHSLSLGGVLRGLHAQRRHPQGKLVRVVEGEVFDVAVDVRRGSPTFGRWEGVELSAANKRQLWIPEGFAHGFLALEDDTHFLYKTTDVYARDCERSIRWDDPGIGVSWPLPAGIDAPFVAPKDAAAPPLAAAELPG